MKNIWEMLDIQKEVLKKANAKEDYSDLAMRLEELREEKNEVMLKEAANENLKERLKEMNDFLEEMVGAAAIAFLQGVNRKIRSV